MIRTAATGAAAAIAMALAAGTALTGQQASTYKAPRTAQGTPDIQGIWQVLNTAEYDIQTHQARWGVPAGMGIVRGEEIPYLPAALEQKRKNQAAGAEADPAQQCFFPGTPRIMYMPFPFRVVQTDTYVQFFFEFGHHTRIIYTAGQPHHTDIPMWMGDARGRWEGETFVVDTRNFNGMTWFDRAGNHHSDAMTLIERFTRTGPDHLQYEATITDPKTFSRPWTISFPFYRRIEDNARLLEYECFAMDIYERGRVKHMEKPRPPQ
ncbi:MAG: hypothetical protein FJW23_02460 [Acidimicrobiia bacterium]|nr:hypothetical protein [Acidimicrobiia bacterium]